MIVRTAGGRNREMRLFELSGFIPRPGSPDVIWDAGVRTPALQVAAVACAVRLVSETIASFVLRTFTGDAADARPVLDSPQARLFQEPAEDWTSFDVISDTLATIELNRCAFLWKTLSKRGEVLELFPIDADYIQVTRDRPGGPRRIRAIVEGQIQDVTRNVTYVRGWSPIANDQGVSTPELHQRQLQMAQSFIEYQGRYFSNDGTPGILLTMQGKPDARQRKDMLDSFVKRHAGARNARRVGLLYNGATATEMRSTLRDAQAPDVAERITLDIALMFRIYPRELIHAQIRTPETPEAIRDKCWSFTLMPRAARLQRALHADYDLFPDRSLWPRFDTTSFLRGDIATTADMIHQLVQVGVLTPNEGRAMFGLPPVAGGDERLVTPVGAQQNPELAALVDTLLESRRNGAQHRLSDGDVAALLDPAR
ncbi:MAG: phage portal protein [Jatrophihabitantaceae bacterium]